MYFNHPKGKELTMTAILKSTGERGFAYMDDCDGCWYFNTQERSFAAGWGRRILRSEIVLIPERVQ